ncbi:MAG: hypothetical protein ACFFCV_05725 [Promethearchaeota archaeon]
MTLALTFTIFMVLFLLFLICLLITGVFVLYKGIKQKLLEIIILGLVYLLLPIGFIGNIILGFGRFFQIMLTSLSIMGIGIFTYLTFHRKKKSRKPKFWLLITILLCIFRIPITILNDLLVNPLIHYISALVFILTLFTTFEWLAYSANSFYINIKESEIEPWIKLRYRLIVASSFIYPFYSIWTLFQPWNVGFADSSNLMSVLTFSLISVFSVGFGIILFIAWIMPNFLKLYINKKNGFVKEKEIDLSEKELMKFLKDQLSGG